VIFIGVTGLIGSGKSEVTSVFENMGAEVIDCDQLGKEVVESDTGVIYRLVLEFGSSILTRSKTLDRKQLGRLAFADTKHTELLNSIVHPALLKELDRRLVRAKKRGQPTVVDAALLIYWGYHKHMDYTILVHAPRSLRETRLLHAGWSREEIVRRTKSQLSLSYLRSQSDIVINNDKDLDGLRKKAKMLYQRLTDREIG